MKILNIHGYHGSPRNSAYKALDPFGCEIIAPELDYDSVSPENILGGLKYILTDKRPDIVVGTSLGGFYAAVLSAQHNCPVILINPFLMSFLTFDGDVRPRKDTKALIGLFGSLSKIDISNVSCIVGDNDELLGDHRFTEKLLGNARFRRISGGGHSGHTLPLKDFFAKILPYYTDTLPRKEWFPGIDEY
ncbi:YqiA/YcfP family alpha/beta fold hydrolase [Ruminococcus sp. NK3A76]|uniref:YqiA/YcfP family alpha/beta fold hydrolase n=1 Tax=Ruminococcus sp. NK3A76 TaxID=877411 RepID=UPI000690F3D0|nr:YqiA/YcfP family alpha/beta fold hydrolase [Ruminococcus sp. NK3A76]